MSHLKKIVKYQFGDSIRRIDHRDQFRQSSTNDSSKNDSSTKNESSTKIKYKPQEKLGNGLSYLSYLHHASNFGGGVTPSA